MSEMNDKKIFSVQLLAAGLVGAASLAYLYSMYKRKSFPFNLRDPLRHRSIKVINTKEECIHAVANIKIKSSKYRVLGFDCEWVTQNGQQHPVALLQLASHDGYCALFRLCKIHHMPQELKNILEDITILKVGVAPVNDAKYLYNDYDVRVRGIVDLRHLSISLSEKPDGLSNLGKKYLNLEMDKSWHVRCSDWEASELTSKQIEYAAADAYVAVIIFKILINKILSKKYGFSSYLRFFNNWNQIIDICKDYIDINFKQNKALAMLNANNNKYSYDFKSLLSPQQRETYKQPQIKSQKRYYSQVQKKLLYQNCIMETSSGEVLCTCDKKKAEWYVEKELADIVNEDPFTIRLRFEPAGKSVGDVGRFYQMPRENRCVVCGQEDSHIRKNVVPKEYRRLFPNIMKDHSSHDVLLLCINCHQTSNIKDQTLRSELAETCNAPFSCKDHTKLIESVDLKKVKSAARALLSKHKIPEEKIVELKDIIFQFYPNQIEITEELLIETSKLDYRFDNPQYEPHGQIVVEYFKNKAGGLLRLEQMWREHFINTMNPKYMPELWSTTHTKSRVTSRGSKLKLE